MLLATLVPDIQLLIFQSLYSIDDAHHLTRSCQQLNEVLEANRYIIFRSIIVSSFSVLLGLSKTLLLCEADSAQKSENDHVPEDNSSAASTIIADASIFSLLEEITLVITPIHDAQVEAEDDEFAEEIEGAVNPEEEQCQLGPIDLLASQFINQIAEEAQDKCSKLSNRFDFFPF